MRELHCANLESLKKFFVSMVFSQLYGLIFVDAEKVEFERGVGIFVKASLGLPDSFPHVVAMALLHVKHVKFFQVEQQLRFMLRWESRVGTPAFDALVIDRSVLFPMGVGLNAGFGRILVELGFSLTLDYRQHYQVIMDGLRARVDGGHRAALLATEGRAFWTEVGPDGYLSKEFVQVFSTLTWDAACIVVLLLGDMLCWSGLKNPTRKCPYCQGKFTTAHFFSCSQFFFQDSGWRVMVGLCGARSWEDVLDYIFHTMSKWVTLLPLCKPEFRLSVLSYTNLCSDVHRLAFRWNV
jgi:hypothetical protein